MKKIVAMILCLALAIGCCAAVAETAEKESIGKVNVNGDFEIKCAIPEGYKVSITDASDDKIIASILSEDENKPRVTLSVAFNDIYTQDGVAMKLNDVSEEDLALIKESFEDEADTVEFRDGETALGTKVLIVTGELSEKKFADVYSIYNSYEIEAVVTSGRGENPEPLTDEQINMIIDFFTNMDFVEIAK